MFKTFWQLYGNWFIISLGIVTLVLGGFFLYFATQYPSLREAHFQESFDRLEQLIENQRMIRGVDYELALETVQRVRQLMESGQIDYSDFAKLRLLNQLPSERRPMGREFNQLFREMNTIMDIKLAGEMERFDEVIPPGFGRRAGLAVSPATAARDILPAATPET